MSGPTPIQPDKPSFAAQPPPTSRGAVDHQGRGASWIITELGKVVNNQKHAIEGGNYYIKMMKWLQQILAEFTQAIKDIKDGVFPGGIDELLKALRDLNQIHGMSDKELGGPFGAAMGKGVKAQINTIYNGVSKALGGFLKGTPGSNLGKLLQEYLANPGKTHISAKDTSDLQVWVESQIKMGYMPFKGLSNAIDNEVSALDTVTALWMARLARWKNNGVSALQTDGKVINQFWKVIIQMLSSIQSGG